APRLSGGGADDYACGPTTYHVWSDGDSWTNGATRFILNHMVYSQIDGRSTARALDRTFAALADPTRRAILSRLATGGAAISDLAQPFAMSLPAVSKHLRVLERAGLATIRRDGRVRRCRLVPEPLRDA